MSNLRQILFIKKKEDFDKPKIVWNRIASVKQFGIVDSPMFIQDSMHFIIGESLHYLSSILNSRTIQWLFSLIIGEAAGGNAGNADNVWNLHIPLPNDKYNEDAFSKLIANKDYDEIESIVCKIFGLSEIEQSFIRFQQSQ